MREALSGYFNYVLLFAFLLIVCGFCALAVNYTKAYKMKNFVLKTMEQYEGNVTDNMKKRVEQQANALGYRVNGEDYVFSSWKDRGYTCVDEQGWCYLSGRDNPNLSNGCQKYKGKFCVDVVVFINLDMPVVNRMIPGDFQAMTGRTNSIPDLND